MVSFQFNHITIILFYFYSLLFSSIFQIRSFRIFSRKALNRRGLQTFALSWFIINDLSDNNLSQRGTNSWLFRGIQCRLSPVVFVILIQIRYDTFYFVYFKCFSTSFKVMKFANVYYATFLNCFSDNVDQCKTISWSFYRIYRRLNPDSNSGTG